ncbi:MAG TPA: signal peptidase I [Rhizomicrobium sp.]|nr:signal peptidase I [Rhizomicrobium sp.]
MDKIEEESRVSDEERAADEASVDAGEPAVIQDPVTDEPVIVHPDPVVTPAPREVVTETAPEVLKATDSESWVETVKTVVYALLIALVIRTFLFQLFNIPSGSMINTLLVGDYLFVEKYAYGYSHYSFPFGIAPFSGRVLASEPTRGDVIVFKMPNKNSPQYEEDFIKRLIGLPGDRIQMMNGQLFINGKAIPKMYAGKYDYTDEAGMTRHTLRYKETLPNGKSYFVLDTYPDGPFDNTDVYTVPPGHYFMMGDNRDDSNDSRADVGYVPSENLVGKAQIIFYSYDGSAPFWQFWNWPWEIRYDRLFTWID